MACHCFDFCTGEESCFNLPADDQSLQACIDKCHANGLGYWWMTTVPSGWLWLECPEPAMQLVPQQSALGFQCSPNDEYPWLCVVPGAFHGTKWRADNARFDVCLPNGFDPNSAPDYTIAPDADGSTNNQLLKFPGFVRVWVPISSCAYKTISCCEHVAVGEPLNVPDLPITAYPLGRGCYEGNYVNTGNYCVLRPCCRQGIEDWPPYPPGDMFSHCDLRTPEGCLRIPGYFPTTHRQAFSCWFSHTCNPNVEACGDVPRECAQERFGVAYLTSRHGGATADQQAEFISLSPIAADADGACRYRVATLDYVMKDGREDGMFWTCYLDTDYGIGQAKSIGAIAPDDSDTLVFGYEDHLVSNN